MRRPLAVALTILSILAVAGCSAPAAPSPVPPSASATPQQPEETVVLSCETLIRSTLVQSFLDTGYTPDRSDFMLIDKPVKNGIMCLWIDRDGGEDTAQFFGWAPLTPEQSEDAQKRLAETGWIREEGRGGVYFSEDPEFALVTDDDGYGTTYLFRDGWVRMADTKQNLLVIDWPRG